MYQIRGLKSTMDKITYPVGNVHPSGNIIEDMKYVFSGGNGYSTSNLFSKSTDYYNDLNFTSEVMLYTDKATGKKAYKLVGVQPRISNNGSLLPHNTSDRVIGPTYWAGWGGNTYFHQKFLLNRNAIPYSPVNEVMILQAKLTNQVVTGNFQYGTYIDHRFGGTTGVGKIIDTSFRTPTNVEPQSIVTPNNDELRLEFRDAEGNKLFTSLTQYYSVLKAGENFYVDDDSDVTYKYIDVAITKANINQYLSLATHAVIINGSRLNGTVLDLTEELKQAIVSGTDKFTYIVFKMLLTLSRGHFDNQAPIKNPLFKAAVEKSLDHQSDFLPDQTIVDPAGEFIILKFNRPTFVDIFFNDVVQMYEARTNAAYEIRVNKKEVKFTTGGVLSIVQKHKFSTLSFNNRTFNFTVPDTVAPDAPSFLSATRNTVTGLAKNNDMVYVEKDDIVVGSVKATATNTFEITLATVELTNDDIITIYTKDNAGNKSTPVVVTITEIASENKINMMMNSDILNMS